MSNHAFEEEDYLFYMLATLCDSALIARTSMGLSLLLKVSSLLAPLWQL